MSKKPNSKKLKIILLTGAARVGKDTWAKKYSEKHKLKTYAIADLVKFDAIKSLSTPLYTRKDIEDVVEAFEPIKDDPIAKLGGLTPREFYIHYAENYIKPVFGNAYFINRLINKINRKHMDGDTVIITDLGFDIELDKLVSNYGANNMTIVEIVNPEPNPILSKIKDSRKPIKNYHAVKYKEVLRDNITLN